MSTAFTLFTSDPSVCEVSRTTHLLAAGEPGGWKLVTFTGGRLCQAELIVFQHLSMTTRVNTGGRNEARAEMFSCGTYSPCCEVMCWCCLWRPSSPWQETFCSSWQKSGCVLYSSKSMSTCVKRIGDMYWYSYLSNSKKALVQKCTYVSSKFFLLHNIILMTSELIWNVLIYVLVTIGNVVFHIFLLLCTKKKK